MGSNGQTDAHFNKFIYSDVFSKGLLRPKEIFPIKFLAGAGELNYIYSMHILFANFRKIMFYSLPLESSCTVREFFGTGSS